MCIVFFSPGIMLTEQIIIMGADVTHPGADQEDSGKPSIAAVVDLGIC
jgi:hypothetical protein